jgi:hypothetical protein
MQTKTTITWEVGDYVSALIHPRWRDTPADHAPVVGEIERIDGNDEHRNIRIRKEDGGTTTIVEQMRDIEQVERPIELPELAVGDYVRITGRHQATGKTGPWTGTIGFVDKGGEGFSFRPDKSSQGAPHGFRRSFVEGSVTVEVIEPPLGCVPQAHRRSQGGALMGISFRSRVALSCAFDALYHEDQKNAALNMDAVRYRKLTIETANAVLEAGVGMTDRLDRVLAYEEGLKP